MNRLSMEEWIKLVKLLGLGVILTIALLLTKCNNKHEDINKVVSNKITVEHNECGRYRYFIVLDDNTTTEVSLNTYSLYEVGDSVIHINRIVFKK